MEIITIAAVAKNNVIGDGQKMLWHISEDFKRFKKLTMGSPIVMGRHTAESLPKALPGRKNIVVSRKYEREGFTVINGFEKAVEYAKSVSETEKVFLIGGRGIFEAGIEVASKLEITHVDLEPKGDVLFPDLDRKVWKETEREDNDGHSFVTYIKA